LRDQLNENNLDSLFISNPFNIYYLTGFKGVSETEREVTSLVDSNGIKISVPKLYQEEALRLSKVNFFEVVISEERDNLFNIPSRPLSRNEKIGFEADDLKFSELEKLKKTSNARYIPTYNLVEGLRIVKDKEELTLVKRVVKTTDNSFTQIKNEIKIGMTEKQIANRILEIMENFGSDGYAFEPIVASGSNSSLPHYVSQNIPIKEGILLIDAGAKYNGYNGDLTRTFFLGSPSEKFVKTYNLISKAQEAALKTIKPGIKEEEPYKKTVEVFGIQSKYFIHGLGHGIGLEVHETPYLRKGKTDLLKEGMLITVEPGLYYPGWGGIRVEDYVVVTKNGCEVLSKTPKSHEDIIIKI